MNERTNENHIVRRIICVALCLLVIALQWVSLEMSISGIDGIIERAVLSNIMCFCMLVFFNCLVLMIIRRIKVTFLITGAFFFVFSVLNDIVLRLHGSPIRISEIGNIGTALHVAEGYSVPFASKQLLMAAMFIIEILVLIIIGRLSNTNKVTIKASAAGLLVSFIIAVVIWNIPAYTPIIGFAWTFSANEYGYTSCLVKDAMIYAKKVEKPADYSEEEVDRIENAYQSGGASKSGKKDDELPDIILILNETFYDPGVFNEIELETDKPYLGYYYGLKENERAYAAVPYTGTNSTEYELLTSNSKQLINPSAPFVYYDLPAANSVVSYLKKLGYETWAMHNAEPENYNRNVAYKDLGFDHIMFYSDMLPDEIYGNRRGTDRNDYQDLIQAYENSGDNPRFIYMLTIQNHAGYEQNDSSYDTVHCRNDYGAETDDMDEFLTSISMSDEAISLLIDYFSKSDRKVIIGMLGDHPPSFVTAWSNETFSKNEDVKSYVKRNMTPFMIWNNFSEEGENQDYVTTSDVVPMMLNIGGCPLSPYYQQALKVHEETPVHLGEYIIDANDNLIPQKETGNYAIHDYLIMEYNNLQSVDKRRQFLFEP